ncbi:MAG: ATP-binding protein, partial [Proteobacteria bacterium]|nr:ATP-binding protein [Pseudomonadota bacterium]
ARCDRRMLQQALTNLLLNAADAVEMRENRDEAGMITLRVESGAEEVRLSVIDNGLGLPDDRTQLMEPYVTHKPKGTGLGLAIVKKIMEDHGGKIELEDRADGHGAVATLILPADEAAEAALSPPLPAAASAAASPSAQVPHGA